MMLAEGEQVANFMHSGKVQAVQDVTLSAPPGLEESFRWFYVDLAGLTEVHERAPGVRLCFRSHRIELRIQEAADVPVDPIPVRLTIRVPSLVDAARLLEERGLNYARILGLSFTDQSLMAFDPAGYRIEFRRRWPDWPF